MISNKTIPSCLLLFFVFNVSFSQTKELNKKYSFALEYEYKLELKNSLHGVPDLEKLKKSANTFYNGAHDFYDIMSKDKKGYYKQAPYYFAITLALSLIKDENWLYENHKDELGEILNRAKVLGAAAEVTAAEAVFKAKDGQFESAKRLSLEASKQNITDSVAFKYLQKLSSNIIATTQYDFSLKALLRFEQEKNLDSMLVYAKNLYELRPTEFTPLYSLMAISYQLQKYREAIKWAALAKKSRQNADVSLCIAVSYEHLNKLDSALFFAHEAVDLNSNEKFLGYLNRIKLKKIKDSNPEQYALLKPMIENNDYSDMSAFFTAYPSWSNTITHEYDYAGTTPYTINREISFSVKNGSIYANLFSLITVENNKSTELIKTDHVKYYLANIYHATVNMSGNGIDFVSLETYFENSGFNGFKTLFYSNDGNILPAILRKKCNCSQPENIASQINNIAGSQGFQNAKLFFGDPTSPYILIDGQRFLPGSTSVRKSDYLHIEPNITGSDLNNAFNYANNAGSSAPSSASVCPKCGGSGQIEKFGRHLDYVDYKDSQGRKLYSNLEPVEGSYKVRCVTCLGTGKVK